MSQSNKALTSVTLRRVAHSAIAVSLLIALASCTQATQSPPLATQSPTATKASIRLGYPHKDYLELVNQRCKLGAHTCLSDVEQHTGTDSGNDRVTEAQKRIVAIGPGVVRQIQANGESCRPQCAQAYCGCKDHGLGNSVILEHIRVDGTSFSSVYSHLAMISADLIVGKCVDKGQSIGLMSRTGYGIDSYSTHLHLEIKSHPVLEVPGSLEWGYAPKSWNLEERGVFDPLDYLDKVEVRACDPVTQATRGVTGLTATATSLPTGSTRPVPVPVPTVTRMQTAAPNPTSATSMMAAQISTFEPFSVFATFDATLWQAVPSAWAPKQGVAFTLKHKSVSNCSIGEAVGIGLPEWVSTRQEKRRVGTTTYDARAFIDSTTGRTLTVSYEVKTTRAAGGAIFVNAGMQLVEKGAVVPDTCFRDAERILEQSAAIAFGQSR